MKELQITNTIQKKYGIRYSEKNNTTNIEDYIPNLSISLPLGELLLTVIELIDLFENELNENNISKIYKDYFKDKYYDLSSILTLSKIDILEIKRLSRIRDYVSLCLENQTYCNVSHLESFCIGIFDLDNKINLLFNQSRKHQIRKYHSNIKISPMYSTQTLINEYLRTIYSEFEFCTTTGYETLSELCVISLFEIFSLGLSIKKCKHCKRYFIGSAKSEYCPRTSSINDFLGCKKFKTFIDAQNLNRTELKVLYKRVYNRLLNRAKKNRVEDIQYFEKFKDEWTKIGIQEKYNPNKSEILIEFLKRWN